MVHHLTTSSNFNIVPNVKGVPNRLRLVRAEKRISQLDTALAIGISQSKLSLIENSYVEPTAEERAALARVLGVDESDVFPESVAS